jgi:hypothetical protein
LNYATSEPPRTENNDTEKFNVYKTFYITEKNSDRKHTNVLYRLNKREQGDSATRVHYEQEFEWSIWKDWVWAIRNDILWKNNQYALKSRQLTDIKIDSQKWTKTIEFTTYQTPFQYDSIKQVGSCFFIKKDKKIGVFSNKAAQIIPIEYDTIIKTEIGFIVRKDKMYGTVDENGKSILPLEYDFIDTKITQTEHSYKLKAKKNGLWGVYDIHFPRVVLPHIYKKIDFLAPCFIKATLPNDAVFYIIYKSKKQQCYQEMYPNGLCHKPQPLK